MKDFIQKVVIVFIAIAALYYFFSPYETCMRTQEAAFNESAPRFSDSASLNLQSIKDRRLAGECNEVTNW